MGVSKLLCLSLFFLLLLLTPCSIRASIADHKFSGRIGDIANSSNLPPQPLPPPSSPPPLDFNQRSNISAFKPSITVIIGILTTMFSITFLLLLYAKHCKRGNGYTNGNPNSRGGITPSSARKNSGIDRIVIDSLPIFRFASLRGQKEGLECAVCLNRFEPAEVLRLLPKCKHAFHVECVDTWLDAHSTCPLCRYRVDPEDILLVEDNKILQGGGDYQSPPPAPPPPVDEEIEMGFRPVPGRHSSAGERGSGFHQIKLQRPVEESETQNQTRRSLDSYNTKRKSNNNNEAIYVGCFDRHRKDGILLTEGTNTDRTSFERRFEHRIIVSGERPALQQRWSDVQLSDLLYLRSEMIISDSRRFSRPALGSRPSDSSSSSSRVEGGQHIQNGDGGIDDGNNGRGQRQSGRSVINSRSVSEITGLSRFAIRSTDDDRRQKHQRQAGVVSRWLAWISQSQSQPAARSGRPTIVV